jgi:hypothetical protein
MKKYIGIALIILGLIFSGISLFADQIGIGDVDPDHFILGTKQIIGAVAGGIVFLTGIFFIKK